jgi:predicted membrane-bound dolichyl-phosphate-mannose-protein mannosyltransferase
MVRKYAISGTVLALILLLALLANQFGVAHAYGAYGGPASWTCSMRANSGLPATFWQWFAIHC